MEKNWKVYSLNELKVRTTQEFICSIEHFKPNEIYVAWEEDDKYVVRTNSGDMWVPKNEFNNYFEIIDTVNHSFDPHETLIGKRIDMGLWD